MSMKSRDRAARLAMSDRRATGRDDSTLAAARPATEGSEGDRRLTGEDLRFILGLKLKSLRQAKGLTLQALAGRCGLSVSYLSEIEKGKKYPKAEKLIAIARALGAPFEEVVSPQVNEELAPVKTVFSTEFLQGFPFELFGVDPEDLFGIATERPERTAALIRALLDVGRTYDVQVEQFLLAALRSYQQLNHNYFPDLEEAAARCRAEHGWQTGEMLGPATLAAVLEREHGYELDFATLPAHPDLRGLRSVYLGGPGGATPGTAGTAGTHAAAAAARRPRRLLVNGNLMPSQQAFVLARELGYRYLDLRGARAITSSWIKVESFDQVLNNFYASYFAGALLIERDRLVADLRAWFARERWDGDALVACIGRYEATPELFFHRLTELMPRLLGLEELFFLRFAHGGGSDRYELTKFLNVSRVPVPHRVGLDETYCRRWPALRLMRQLDERRRSVGAAPAVTAQRSRFLDTGAEFFVVTMARPLALASDATSSVSIGFLLDDACKRAVRFWDDPAVPRVVVNLTCERCPLPESECGERGAPPTVWRRRESQERKEHALAELRAGSGGPG
jgi:XRE family transcriptional regulator, fatty acid utilization regulator